MARMRSPIRLSAPPSRLRASSSRRPVSRWRSRVAWSASWLALNSSTTVSTWSFIWSSAAWLRRRAILCAGVSARATLTPTPARVTPATSSRPMMGRAPRRPFRMNRALWHPLRRWGGRRTTCNSGLLSGWGICSGGGQRVLQGYFWAIWRTWGLGDWGGVTLPKAWADDNSSNPQSWANGRGGGKTKRRAAGPGGRDQPRAALPEGGALGGGVSSRGLALLRRRHADPPAVVAGRARHAAIDRLVAVDHVGDVELLGHALAAELGLQLVDLDDRRGELLEFVADEAGDPVLHHLGHRAAAQRDHGCPAGHGLDHHDPERLVPLDREDQAAGARQQVFLLLGVGLAEPLGVGPQQRADALLEVALLRGLVALGGHHDRVAGLARRLDRQVGRLLRVHAPEEEAEVVLMGVVGVLVHGDAVVDHACPAQVLGHPALTLRDRHQRDAVGHQLVVAAHLAFEWAVGGQHGGDTAARGHQRAGEAVVVDDVDAQVVQRLGGGQRVQHLGHALADARERRVLVGGDEVRAGAGATRSDDGHVVTAGDQAFGQPVDHPLDAAVPLWGDGVPGRRDDADAHRTP